MTIFKDPEDVNFVFYGIIIILAIVGSLFFGKPASPEHLKGKNKEYVVFGMNTNTNTWSIVEFINPDWACILANGVGADVLINNGNMMENE